MSDLSIVGGGDWAASLAFAAIRAGRAPVLLSRRPQRGPFEVITDFAAMASNRLIVLAVPSTVARDVLRRLGDYVDGSHVILHGIRGLGLDRLETISDVIREETPVRRVGALGGPVQASELSEGRPSVLLCGSPFPEVLAASVEAFQSASLRVYRTTDLRGLEWASALVGCLAVAVGYAQGAGAGPGLLAALISRAVEEAGRLVAAAGADEQTMLGLGGVGDLLASIALSDRPEVVLGKALARGLSVAEAVAEVSLRVEAVELIPRVTEFARQRAVKATVFDALAQLLAGGSPVSAARELFS